MKKIIISTFTLLSLLFSLGSCSSDENIPETQQAKLKQAVTIDIAGIEHEFKTEKGSAKAATTDSCYLWYTIHKKSDGSFVKEQQIDKSDIQSLKDTLEQGDYIYSIFASTTQLKGAFDLNKDNYNNTVLTAHTVQQDLFYKSVNVTVGSNSINDTIILPRLVSKVTVNIEDPQLIPQTVDRVAISVSYIQTMFNISTGLTNYAPAGNIPNLIDISRVDLLAADSNQLELYLLPNAADFYRGDKRLDLSINLFATNTLTGMPEVLNSILIKRNLIVEDNGSLILSGRLFPPQTNNSGLRIDTDWKETVVLPFDNN